MYRFLPLLLLAACSAAEVKDVASAEVLGAAAQGAAEGFAAGGPLLAALGALVAGGGAYLALRNRKVK